MLRSIPFVRNFTARRAFSSSAVSTAQKQPRQSPSSTHPQQAYDDDGQWEEGRKVVENTYATVESDVHVTNNSKAEEIIRDMEKKDAKDFNPTINAVFDE